MPRCKQREFLRRAPCKNGLSALAQRKFNDELGCIAIGTVDENIVVHRCVLDSSR